MEDRFAEMLQKLNTDREKQALRADKLENDMREQDVVRAREMIEITEQSAAIANVQSSLTVYDAIASYNDEALTKQELGLLRDSMRRARNAYKAAPKAE